MLILRGEEVRHLLAGRETEVLDAVRDAYRAHASGETEVPHSLFLRLPGEGANRIIALPAYLGGREPVAGVKWIGSFPANIRAGMERASAVIVLNSTASGRPEAILEGSVISAARTGACAAVAAAAMLPGGGGSRIGVLGCGVINFEVVRFLGVACPPLAAVQLYDIDRGRAERFARRCQDTFPHVEVAIAGGFADLLRGNRLISIATTASAPHIERLDGSAPGSVVLHVSLRDLSPALILECDNVVDDADHVCRERTSLHLAEQLTGGRDFIRCSIGEVLLGSAPARAGDERTTVFSPFGLGILDLALASLVVRLATERGIGLRIDDFLPA
jgi:2,3-diaminopropionate biosynthesis protein SbnB